MTLSEEATALLVPRVSVVVPTFKATSTLREAVTSLLQQDFDDLEVIVVDDACPERSPQVIEDITDPRLKVIRLDKNQGLSGARNAGIEVSRGRYIAFLDADDTSLRHRIRLQAQVLDERPIVGLVGGLHNRMTFDGNVSHSAADVLRLNDSALRAYLLFENPFTSAVMIRRQALPPYGYRSMLCEDYAMTCDVAERFEIAMVRTALINYRANPAGIMANEKAKVSAGAESIKRRLLSKVGVPAAECDTTMLFPMRLLGAPGPQREKTLLLERYRTFLRLVKRANETTGIYASKDLADAIARRWDLLLLEAARRGGVGIGPKFAAMFTDFWPIRASRSRANALARSFLNLCDSKRIQTD